MKNKLDNNSNIQIILLVLSAVFDTIDTFILSIEVLKILVLWNALPVRLRTNVNYSYLNLIYCY